MSNLRKHLLTASGFAIVIVALLLATASTSQAVPGDKDVRVVNATFEPVPTAAQGTTTIAGGVSVTNTPASPVPVVDMNDGRQPFQVSTNGTQNGTNVSTLTFATVPAGKRLVIEFVSVSGQVPPGQHVELMHINTVAGPFGGATHDLLVNPQPDAVIGDALFRASQQVRLYADAGTTVTATLRRNSSAGLATYGATISGYLVDL